jgi:ParB family chromosome partitioning protein
MNSLLKQRMAAVQQASELNVGNEDYETLFQASSVAAVQPVIRSLPLDSLQPFFTADIGFKPYSPAKLQAFSEQLAAEGLFERIIVRPIPGSSDFEILSGHNRTAAGRLLGWSTIPAEIVDADDGRATSIAVATNLLRRQDLTIIERGKAYKALLEAKNRNGQRNALRN